MTEYQIRILKCLKAAKCVTPNDYYYQSPEDFVIKEGLWYKPQPLPRGFFIGKPLMCFGNAIIVSLMTGLRYVEGYAYTPNRDEIHHHAWNIDKHGWVYDTTWIHFGGTGMAYLGVEFSLERADDCTWEGDATILNDYRRKWPLLKTAWTGETSWEMQPGQAERLQEWKAKLEQQGIWADLKSKYKG
jgi:hypothetical protein